MEASALERLPQPTDRMLIIIIQVRKQKAVCMFQIKLEIVKHSQR